MVQTLPLSPEIHMYNLILGYLTPSIHDKFISDESNLLCSLLEYALLAVCIRLELGSYPYY